MKIVAMPMRGGFLAAWWCGVGVEREKHRMFLEPGLRPRKAVSSLAMRSPTRTCAEKTGDLSLSWKWSAFNLVHGLVVDCTRLQSRQVAPDDEAMVFYLRRRTHVTGSSPWVDLLSRQRKAELYQACRCLREANLVVAFRC